MSLSQLVFWIIFSKSIFLCPSLNCAFGHMYSFDLGTYSRLCPIFNAVFSSEWILSIFGRFFAKIVIFSLVREKRHNSSHRETFCNARLTYFVLRRCYNSKNWWTTEKFLLSREISMLSKKFFRFFGASRFLSDSSRKFCMNKVIAPLPRDFGKGVFTPLFLGSIATQKCSVYQASYHFIAIVNHQLRERSRGF